jgi:hypothetical protein
MLLQLILEGSFKQQNRKSIGETGFEPATSWSRTKRSSQAELLPEGKLRTIPHLPKKAICHSRLSWVNKHQNYSFAITRAFWYIELDMDSRSNVISTNLLSAVGLGSLLLRRQAQ